MAKKRLKRGFYSYVCYLWLFCHELNLRNLVISRVFGLEGLASAQKCLKPGFCRYFAKVCFKCGHLWREDIVISRVLATLSKMAFAWTGLEGVVSAPKCAKNTCLCECGLRLLVFWPPALVQVGFATSVFANVGCGSVFLFVVFSFAFVLVCFLSFSPSLSASLFLLFSFSVFCL